MTFENSGGYDRPFDEFPPDRYAESTEYSGDAITPEEGGQDIEDGLTYSTRMEYDPAVPSNEVELPEDIDDILDNRLVEQTAESGDTRMFSVEDRPDLWVRVNEGYEPEELAEAKQAADRLAEHGVRVLPSTQVQRGEEVHQVTKKVDGQRLDHLLAEEEFPEGLVEELDRTWAGLSDSLATDRQTGQAFPGDVTDTFQYMYGTPAGEQEPGVWLVDLPKSSTEFEHPNTYEEELLDITNTVTEIEKRLGHELPGARAAIGRALPLCEETEQYGDALENAVRHVLATGEELRPGDDERLLALRNDQNRLEPSSDRFQRMVQIGLEPADMPGGETQKSVFPGDPDVLFRENPDVDREEIVAAKRAADNLIQYGVNVLPSNIVDYGDATYVATSRVEGLSLEDALAADPSDELMGEVDNTWRGLAEALGTAFDNDQAYAEDVVTPPQYMLGIRAGETDPKLWLIDLPTAAVKLSTPDHMEEQVLWLANGIVEVEELAGRRLEQARTAIGQVIPRCRDSDLYGDGYARAVEHVLATGEVIQPHDLGTDEILDRLRTR